MSVMIPRSGDNPVVSMSRNAARSRKSAYSRQRSLGGRALSKYAASRHSYRSDDRSISDRRRHSLPRIRDGNSPAPRKSSQLPMPASQISPSVTLPTLGKCMKVCFSMPRTKACSRASLPQQKRVERVDPDISAAWSCTTSSGRLPLRKATRRL